MNKIELIQIVGGASISGTVLNALIRAINASLEVGRSLGSAIRRWKTKTSCAV